MVSFRASIDQLGVGIPYHDHLLNRNTGDNAILSTTTRAHCSYRPVLRLFTHRLSLAGCHCHVLASKFERQGKALKFKAQRLSLRSSVINEHDRIYSNICHNLNKYLCKQSRTSLSDPNRRLFGDPPPVSAVAGASEHRNEELLGPKFIYIERPNFPTLVCRMAVNTGEDEPTENINSSDRPVSFSSFDPTDCERDLISKYG